MRSLQETTRATSIELFLSDTIIDDTARMDQQEDINSNYFMEHVIDDTALMDQQQDINSNCFIKHVIDDTALMYQQQDINSNSFLMNQSAAQWNRSEDKVFEEALVMFPEDSPDRWQKIASKLQGKSPRDVREHYEALVHDVYEIDSGRVELPRYTDDLDWDSPNQISFEPIRKHSSEPERKKGTPWTEEEHKLFLIGLCKFGKGDWRSISRNVVVTRTPTQVASHAQKYFLRQINCGKRERKRSSIHDITTVDNNNVAVPVDQNWIPSPGTADHQQPSALQQFPPPSQVPGQGGLLGYQNYGFPM